MIIRTPRFRRVCNVAYRGLWGGNVRPGSAHAIGRAYLHAVPALVDDRDECSLAEVFKIVADGAMNPRQRPVYLSVAALPSRPLMGGFAPGADVYAIVRGSSHQAWNICVWRESEWRPMGAYVPATAPMDVLAGVTFEADTIPLIAYEAPNVVAMLGERSMTAELNEDQVQQAVRSYAEAGATIARVIDFFEPEDRPVAVRAA
jgi:hypothetical protein